jgi:hypothetical protein
MFLAELFLAQVVGYLGEALVPFLVSMFFSKKMIEMSLEKRGISITSNLGKSKSKGGSKDGSKDGASSAAPLSSAAISSVAYD